MARLMLMVFLGFISLLSTAQITYLGIKADYGFALPYGALSKTYGSYSILGGGLDILTKNNLGLNLELRTGFGNNINIDPLVSLRQADGSIVGLDGLPISGFYEIAAHEANVVFRKILGKKQSGFFVGLGGGIGAYSIGFNDVSNTLVPSIKPLSNVYDQLQRGFITKQQFGYEWHTAEHRLNLVTLLENTAGKMSYVRKSVAPTETLGWTNVIAFRLGIGIALYKNQISKEKVTYY